MVRVELSVIVPIYNEAKSINLLYERIRHSLEFWRGSFEIIFVDDGSIDESHDILNALYHSGEAVKIVFLKRNFGQTAALMAGVEHSHGDSIVFLDGDLQNDPADIPGMLSKLDEGYDVVSGWRKERQDPFFSRRLPFVVCEQADFFCYRCSS